MRYSKFFGKTTRDESKDAVLASHKLLLKGGFIKESTAGRFYFLPLGWRVHEKIRAIIKEEMDAAGAQEMLTPVLHPLDLWKETNRTSTTGFELMKIKDRSQKEFVLGGTAEEMFVDLVRRMNLTYRDLPFNIYQFSSKFRDELRARGGLLRVREFVMKDAYSFDKNEEEFKKTYDLMKQTYSRIFQRLGLSTTVVESDNGYIGGEYCHEFVVESEAGESKFFVEATEDSPYAAHEEVCRFSRDLSQQEENDQEETMGPLTEVDAPRKKTMEDAVKFHKTPIFKHIKNVLYVNDREELILAATRGDLQINEIKLAHQTNSLLLRPATDEEIIKSINSYPGFLSPVFSLKQTETTKKLRIVADLSIPRMKNAITGGNSQNRDLINVNFGRDFQAEKVCDIAQVFEGAKSEKNIPLLAKSGIEVGNIFQLGYHYTNLMKGAEFVNEFGQKQKFYMGCYGIGLGRTMATIAEKFHDEAGLIWPEIVAPFKFHLITILPKNEIKRKEVLAMAGKIMENLGENEVLWDDRQEVSTGEKFATADLIGCPTRLVISEKTNGQVEVKKRNSPHSRLVKMEEII